MANKPQAAPVKYLACESGAWGNGVEDGGEGKENFQKRQRILTGHTNDEGGRVRATPSIYLMNLNPSQRAYKIPRSTLIVIHTIKQEVLLIERADHPGYWQSVTGSQDEGETLVATAIREIFEETGIDAAQHVLSDWQRQNVYEIYPIWRHRYAPGVTHNTESVFGLLLPDRVPITLHSREHLQHVWLKIDQAAPLCFSHSNRDAILDLPRRLAIPHNQ